MEFVPSATLQQSSMVTDYGGHRLTLFPVGEINLNSQSMCISNRRLNSQLDLDLNPGLCKYNAHHFKPRKQGCHVMLRYVLSS